MDGYDGVAYDGIEGIVQENLVRFFLGDFPEIAVKIPGFYPIDLGRQVLGRQIDLLVGEPARTVRQLIDGFVALVGKLHGPVREKLHEIEQGAQINQFASRCADSRGKRQGNHFVQVSDAFARTALYQGQVADAFHPRGQEKVIVGVVFLVFKFAERAEFERGDAPAGGNLLLQDLVQEFIAGKHHAGGPEREIFQDIGSGMDGRLPECGGAQDGQEPQEDDFLNLCLHIGRKVSKINAIFVRLCQSILYQPANTGRTLSKN